MSQYITSTDINSFMGSNLGINATLLAETSEAIFNQLIGSEGILESTKTDYFDAEYVKKYGGRVFYASKYKPTSVTTVLGVSPGTINVDYTIIGRRIEFKEYKGIPSTFPQRIPIVYVSGITTIPNDIKTCCLYIAKGLHKNKEQMDVASFRQDLLSVNYTTGKSMLEALVDPSEVTFINLIANKYRVTQSYDI